MDVRKYTEIKNKLEQVKKEYTMAEGAKAEIMKTLLDKYKVKTEEELQDLIAKTQQEIEEKQEEIEAFQDKLEALTDWSVL